MLFRALLLSALLAGFGAAQTEKVPDKRSAEEIEKTITLWHDRANAFTEAALDDQWQLQWLQPVLQARLAEAWWKDDPIRASAWLKSAIDEVTFEPKNESERDEEHHLRAAEAIFQTCERLKLDEYARKVLAYLMGKAKNEGPGARQGIASVAASVMSAATQVASNDPDQAFALGEKLVELRSGIYVLQVADSIRRTRPAQADQLYESALVAATKAEDYESIYSLMQYPYPYFDGPPASETIKQFTATTIGAFLASPPAEQGENTAYCQSAPRIADHMLQYLAPAQQGIVQAAVQTCRSQSPDEAKDKDAESDVSADDCKTADECLKLAATAKTDERRARLKEEASTFASSEQDPVRALEILNSLTEEEKKEEPNWQSQYDYLSSEAMHKLYKLHDSHSIQALIDHSPNTLRGTVILALVQVREVREDKPYATTLITEARRTLEKFPAENPFTYLGLVNAASEIDPEDNLTLFSFAVNALSHLSYRDLDEERDQQKKSGERRAPASAWDKPGAMVEPVSFNAAVLDQDEPYVAAAIKSIDDPEMRIGFRLTCLRYSLKRYNQEKKAKEELLARSHQ